MSTIDLDRLLKLRLAVARFGEMDSAQWWNTNGLLGRKGALLYARGLPRTHFFAQARVVFAVATSRCAERFSGVANAVSLWSLPAELEDEFDARWETWIDSGDWPPYFEELQSVPGDLLELLRSQGLVTADQIGRVESLRRSAEERAVLVSGAEGLDNDAIALLAASFSRGEPGKLAVPYIRLGAGA
ncbi:MAG: BrxE family protein [Rhodothermales bacterium]|nr:BrxE family protein [Rhodothermales bacterium]MBO6778672.1 BrxE family protein [Rhodothermales bacterium]